MISESKNGDLSPSPDGNYLFDMSESGSQPTVSVKMVMVKSAANRTNLLQEINKEQPAENIIRN